MSEKLRKKEVRKEKDQKQVREPVPLYGNPGSSTKHTQEPVPPNWEPGSRALCPSSKPAKHSRNRFPQTGNRVPGHSARVKATSHAAGTGSPKLGTGFQGTLPKFKTP